MTESEKAFELSHLKMDLSTFLYGKNKGIYVNEMTHNCWMTWQVAMNLGEAYGRKQDTEIAALKLDIASALQALTEAKSEIAELMPLARFGALGASGFTIKQRTDMQYLITEEQIEMIQASLAYSTENNLTDASVRTLKMLQSLLDQPEEVPVAWRHDHGEEIGGFEYYENASCPECQPLYTHPMSPITADDVTDEMTEIVDASSAVIGCACYWGDSKRKEIIAAAVNAYLGAKK
jgi:hypothetical protein